MKDGQNEMVNNVDSQESVVHPISEDKHKLEYNSDKTSEGHHHSHSHSSSHHSSEHGSHHSSYHHSHHSSDDDDTKRSKRHSKRRGKNKKNEARNKKIALVCAIVLFISLMALLLIDHFDNSSYTPSTDNPSGTLNDIIVEVENESAILVSSAINQYLAIDLFAAQNQNITPGVFLKGGEKLDAQVPVALKLSLKSGYAVSYKVELADKDLFKNAKVDYLNEGSSYTFEHLYSNTEYFYRVTAFTNIGSIITKTGSFTTANTPRILSISGISNVRDIGNWKTDSGKRIKQGLLIRGTEMDAAVESGYYLTNEGLVDMLEVFGIKMDMDLRAETLTSMDALGSRVTHKYYDMVMYGDIFTENGKEKIRDVFVDLANRDNYPIYLHCTYGCDRTGTICYLLEALLGVSRGDCLRDYGLSNLNIANIQIVENGLKAYAGDTLKDQVESYLLSCGVSEYQINSIRNIFLGD